MPVSPCATGKVINPATGRCVYKDSPVLKKQISPFKNVKQIIKLEIQPSLQVPVNLNKSNLDKLAMWWKQRLVNWNFIETKNIKVVPDHNREKIVIFYDMPEKISNDDIKINNEMIADPDDDGNYPIYIKNKNIVSIDRNISNGGKDSLVLSKLLKSQTIQVPFEPRQNLLITKPAPVLKVPINNPQNIKDKNIKVLVPPNSQQTVKLVYCGSGKVINPVTGRCVLLSSPLGKKLTSVPYIIINPPSKPQKTPLFIPAYPKVPKPQKGPYQQKPFPKTKPDPIKTSLDTDGDNYVSVKEYLDAVESLGPKEKSKGLNFAFYNQRDLGILFLLTLIKNFKGPIHKIGCIPLFHLCMYKSPNGTFYTMENIKKMNRLYCPQNADFYDGNSVNTYASITIINAPVNDRYNSSNMSILIPPNLSQLLLKCKNDNKYMVICDLTLLKSDNFEMMSHANALVFDIRRKTIERFDPHGGNEYADVKLAYDSESLKSFGRKDFMYGKNNYSKNKFGIDKLNKKKSEGVYYDQFKIDSALSERFKKELPDYTYYGTNYTTPYLGPQLKADEYAGLCVTWSCMYMILRLLNPDLEPADITIKMIDGTPKELRNRILRFQKFIIRTLSKEKQLIK